MIDINYIMNGGKKNASKARPMHKSSKKTKQKKKDKLQSLWGMQKIGKDPLKSLMIKPMNILGDKVTKPQKRILKSRNVIKQFTDWDKDGVINGLDCQPRNPKKHNVRYNEKRDGNYNTFLKETPDYRLDDTDFKNKYKAYDEKELEPYKESRKKGYMEYNPRYNQRDLREYKQNQRPQKTFFGEVKPKQQRVLDSDRDRFTDTDGDGVVDGLDCKPDDPTQHMAFKQTSGVPIVDYPEQYGYTGKTVEMTPNQFMREARASNQAWDMTEDEYEKNTVTKYRYPEEREAALKRPGVNKKELDEYIEYKKGYMDKLKGAIESEDEVVPMPYIEYNERGFPKDHEGRHRAVAARDAGKEKIPVRIISKEKDYEGNPKTYYGGDPKYLKGDDNV
jgi:hypothetical protein